MDQTKHDTDKISEIDKEFSKEFSKDIKLSTEGYSEDSLEFSNLPDASKKYMSQCGTCMKFFSPTMINYISKEELLCKHCFFWLNYDITLRKETDGMYGTTIAKYILNCYTDHDSTKCSRMGDHGGCFLCEYKLGIPILDIKDAEMLDKEKLDKLNSQTNYTEQTHSSTLVTTDITSEIIKNCKHKTEYDPYDCDEFPDTIHI